MLTPWWLIRLTNVVRSSRGVQPSPSGRGADPFEHLPDVPRVQRGAQVVGEHQPGVLPAVPGREPLAGLAGGPVTQRLDRYRGEAEGAAGPLGLGLAVHADRPPHGHVRRDRRAGGGVAVQVDVGPAQGPGFLGADPGQQAEHDVGVHQFGGSADVLQPGPQFHHGQGPGGGDHRHGLVQGQRLGRPAVLAFGGVGQGGDVAANQVVGFGVPDGALERQVPHRHRRGGVPRSHRGQRLAHVGGGQLAELAGADDFKDRLQDVLVLLDGLGGAAVQPGGEPVLGGLADGVVGVAGLGGDSFVELVVQVAELVETAALVWPLTLRAGALAVAGVAQRELAAP